MELLKAEDELVHRSRALVHVGHFLLILLQLPSGREPMFMPHFSMYGKYVTKLNPEQKGVERRTSMVPYEIRNTLFWL